MSSPDNASVPVVGARIQIPRGKGLRFGGRHGTVLPIAPQGTTVHLGNGKLVTYAFDTLRAAMTHGQSV